MKTKSFFLKDLERLQSYMENFINSPTFHENHKLQTKEMECLKRDLELYIKREVVSNDQNQLLYEVYKKKFQHIISACFSHPPL